MMSLSARPGQWFGPTWLGGALLGSLLLVSGCGKESAPAAKAPPTVTVVTVERKDVPVSAEYVAQTQSSQAVNIQARVSGFLDKRVYTEGSVVKAGQVLFRMDQKPFQAQLDAANAALQRNQAALQVATANLDRTKPLAAKNALSQKDLDDAQGQYEQAAAAVEQSKAQVDSAQLDLSYTVISSPVTGVSSYAAVADGTYLNPQNAQLTTVSVLSPMWVNFSLSENEFQRIQNDIRDGRLQLPPDRQHDVEIEQPDGSLFPFTGKITFADPSYNPQTGTFLIRATVDNPKGVLRPNQYVRARLKGGVRPNAILVPQRAVQQGAKGHFAWVVNKEGKAEQRPVVVGDWYGDGWFVSEGLKPGDQLVVDGGQRLSPGATVIVALRRRRGHCRRGAAASAAASCPGGAERARRQTRAGARMFSRFFIERPIFAAVVAILLCLAGLVSMTVLPVQQYPAITPVQVTVQATYPGADSKTLADTRGLADRGADQRRRQHALHEQHQLGHRPAGADRVLLAGHRPRHRPGAGAEPRQPGAAAAARGGAAAGRVGAEEELVDHDAGGRHRHRAAATAPTTSPTTPTSTCSTR